ncbi:MAG TPA: carbon-nitrogen hydrolase family protein [Candidatus Margulisiibacteriota bacterium]|nr:carbon-nitrogen hydrolase family protein [Candidatus Margulisiibacteriota bacterium]
MSTRRYVAAAVQLCAGSDKTANLDKVEAFAAEAARYEARLLVLPEVFLWRGPRSDEHRAAEPIPGPSSNRLGELARQLKLHLLAGSILEESGAERVFNTSVLFDPRGQIVARYRKVHLFDVDIPEHVTIRESDTRVGGTAVATAPTELGIIGMTICYDLRFPELYRQLTLSGAEIITVPSAFTFPTGAAHWEVLLRARAIENQVYVIAPDQIGRSPSGVLNFGHSMVVDPWGAVTARAADREMVICTEIDRDYQARVRRELPCLAHVKLAR